MILLQEQQKRITMNQARNLDMINEEQREEEGNDNDKNNMDWEDGEGREMEVNIGT